MSLLCITYYRVQLLISDFPSERTFVAVMELMFSTETVSILPSIELLVKSVISFDEQTETITENTTIIILLYIRMMSVNH